MNALQERAKDFVVIAAAQDTFSDNTDVVLFLLMLISEIQNEDGSQRSTIGNVLYEQAG